MTKTNKNTTLPWQYNSTVQIDYTGKTVGFF